METFPARYFKFATKYPQSGTRIQLGSSYQFDVPPKAPDQRLFVLTLNGMAYFVNSSDQIDAVVEPGRNLARLEAFYQDHRLAFPFTLQHPVYGNLTVKFNRPLEIPEGIADGNGVVGQLEVELIEIP